MIYYQQIIKVFIHCIMNNFKSVFTSDSLQHKVCKDRTLFKLNDHRIVKYFYYCSCGYNDTRIYYVQKRN